MSGVWKKSGKIPSVRLSKFIQAGSSSRSLDKVRSLIALCADDIELWPPDARPLIGRSAVSAEMARATTRIHCIEITDRRIRGSNEIAYLTASYKTTFSSAEDHTPHDSTADAFGC